MAATVQIVDQVGPNGVVLLDLNLGRLLRQLHLKTLALLGGNFLGGLLLDLGGLLLGLGGGERRQRAEGQEGDGELFHGKGGRGVQRKE
jgi:hypothetical protein